MRSYERGFSVEIELMEGGAAKVRFRCPWCRDHTTVASSKAVFISSYDAAWLVVCASTHCRRPAMVTAEMHPSRVLPRGIHPSPQVKYAPEGVPPEIAEDFEEALGCRAAGFRYGAAVVGRRALQAALIDKGVTKKDLVEQINELSDDVLPKQLKIASHHVRLIGNDGAHVRAVTEDDVDALLEFVELVVEQLYILPHKIAKQTRVVAPQHMPGAPPPAKSAKQVKAGS